MLRSKASAYAVLAVVEIARRQEQGGVVRARDIAALLSLPTAYAAKVMTQLTRANVLASGRGPRGGYRLARGPDEISFLEIIEAVDGLLGADMLVERLPGRERVHRALNDLFDEATSRMRTHLRESTVAAFLRRAQTSQFSQPVAAAPGVRVDAT